MTSKDTSESVNRSKQLIRELYELSEAGAFDHISESTAKTACDFFKDFMDPVLTMSEAAKATKKTFNGLYSKVSRSGVPTVNMGKGIKWSWVKKIIDKSI